LAEVTHTTGKDRRRYWAAERGSDFAGALETRIRDYYSYIGGGQLTHWRELYRAYYGKDPNGTDRSSHRVTDGGEDGSTPEVRQNEFRSELRHILVLATGTRPAIIAKSLTPDYRSQAARRIAESIIDKALSEGALEDRLIEATEMAIVLGEGGLYQWWDPDAGRPLKGEDGQPMVQSVPMPGADDALPPEIAENIGYRDMAPAPEEALTLTRIIREGDIRELALLPDDIVRDPKSKHWPEEAKWVAVRRAVNRWDLAARYPVHAEHILRADSKPTWTETLVDDPEDDRSDDDVVIFEFYHVKSSALPAGKAAVLLDGTVIAEGPMPYDRLPVHIIRPAKEHGKAFGYSKGSDILGPSQALDAAAITALANHDALGFQKLWSRKGSGITIRNLGGGVKVLESTEPPVPLKLMESNEASEKQAAYWKDVIERLSGMNSVARGEPQPSLKSGSALLFVHAQALQANSDIDRAFTRGCTEVFSARIEITRRFCKEKRLIEISGAGKTTLVRSFKGDDLSSVDRVAVDFGSAALRSAAGRMELGKELFAVQALNREQYLSMIATGRFEPATLRPEMLASLIASENELLQNPEIDPNTGVEVIVKVLKTDRHDLHIPEQLILLDDPRARYDNAFVKRVGDHVNAHQYWWVHVWRSEPALAVAMGLPQPPPVTAPIPPPVDAPEMPPLAPDLPAAAPPLGPVGAPVGPPPGAPGAPPPGGEPQQPPPPGIPGVSGGSAVAGLPEMPGMPGPAGNALQGESAGMSM
jgi:hypothetical protein